MKAVQYYNQIKEETEKYTILYQLFCFASIDAFVQEPTEQEYMILSEGIINAYLNVEECDLGKLADCIAEQYANKKFTLEEFHAMSKWDILEQIN